MSGVGSPMLNDHLVINVTNVSTGDIDSRMLTGESVVNLSNVSPPTTTIVSSNDDILKDPEACCHVMLLWISVKTLLVI